MITKKKHRGGGCDVYSAQVHWKPETAPGRAWRLILPEGACGRKRSLCIFKVLVSGLGDLCSEKSSLFRYAILTKTDFNKYVQSCNQHHNQPIEHLHHPTRFPCALLDATLPLQPAPPPRACQYSFAFSTLS